MALLRLGLRLLGAAWLVGALLLPASGSAAPVVGAIAAPSDVAGPGSEPGGGPSVMGGMPTGTMSLTLHRCPSAVTLSPTACTPLVAPPVDVASIFQDLWPEPNFGVYQNGRAEWNGVAFGTYLVAHAGVLGSGDVAAVPALCCLSPFACLVTIGPATPVADLDLYVFPEPAAAPDGDGDGDGFTDAHEFVGGADPNDPLSPAPDLDDGSAYRRDEGWAARRIATFGTRPPWRGSGLRWCRGGKVVQRFEAMPRADAAAASRGVSSAGEFGNAGRTPWRLATDALPNGDAASCAQALKMSRWARNETGGARSGSGRAARWPAIPSAAPIASRRSSPPRSASRRCSTRTGRTGSTRSTRRSATSSRTTTRTAWRCAACS